MRKLLYFTLLCLVVTFGVMYFYHSKVEEYGQAIVQFDEKTGTYFVEVSGRHEVKPTAETKVGMPVSYFKTKGTVMRVSSKLQTKEEIAEECEKNAKFGCFLGGGIVWCFGCIVIFLDYLWERRRKKKFL